MWRLGGWWGLNCRKHSDSSQNRAFFWAKRVRQGDAWEAEEQVRQAGQLSETSVGRKQHQSRFKTTVLWTQSYMLDSIKKSYGEAK